MDKVTNYSNTLHSVWIKQHKELILCGEIKRKPYRLEDPFINKITLTAYKPVFISEPLRDEVPLDSS